MTVATLQFTDVQVRTLPAVLDVPTAATILGVAAKRRRTS
jgi:hypothetical protein